jgi:hypothetical protein
MRPGNVIYGTALGSASGGNPNGTLYAYATASGVYSTLYNFTASEVNGGVLSEAIAVDKTGAAYGTFGFGAAMTGNAVVWQVVP